MSISKNATYNVLGAVVPSLLTLITVPLYLHLVGVERYGVLLLCFLLLGYSSFIDVGLGPALARRIAASRDEQPEAIQEIFWTAFWLSIGAGLVGAICIFAGAAFYFSSAADLGSGLRAEAEAALPLLAAIAPSAIVGSTMFGALQGRERFLTMNLLGTLGNTLLAVLPLATAYLWQPTLSALVAGALLARLIPIPLSFVASKRAIELERPVWPSAASARSLLGFGGWVSLTSIASAIIASLDRLVIGSTIGAAAVSAFSIALSLASRIVLIPHSLGPVLFPRFSSLEKEEHAALLFSSMKAVAVLVTPMSLLIIAITEPFLMIWIGPELTTVAAPIVYALTVGQWVYCITYPLISLLQGSGRPDLVSKLLLAQVVPFALCLWVGIAAFGLIGAAIVVGVRHMVDSFFMLAVARIHLREFKSLLVPFLLVVGGAAAAAALSDPPRLVVLLLLLGLSATWSVIQAPPSIRRYLDRATALFRKG